MKKVVIVNSSSVFEYRVDMLYYTLKKNGYEVTLLSSDYMHVEKKKRKIDKENYISVKTVPYKKNISLRRLYSHYNFSKKCGKILSGMTFDILYLVVPSNSQAWLAKRYKNNKDVKVVMDIIDLWPESFPSTHTDKFPFTLWKAVRDKHLKYADYIITECRLYVKKLKKYIKNKDKKVIYWAHKKNEIDIKPDYDKLPDKGLRLLYLGSINNIIDIEGIDGIIGKLSEKENVFLDIIGAGEKKEEFIESAKAAGAVVTDHGKVYDFKRKQQIMDGCHFGINIMKDTVCIGLSMKSIDYLEGGLPIINNLKDDIGSILKEENCGINIFETGWEEKIGRRDEIINMKKNARAAFEKYFSAEKFEGSVTSVFEELGK
ncbi:MAG: hypothetical protein IJT72_06530 [Lachnospiraceae bacterium]|nr:hypothetical protein [Lachnospiraceae bacterium]